MVQKQWGKASQSQHLRWGLRNKSVRQKVVLLRQWVGGVGRMTGQAGEAGWGQLHKTLHNLFESVFCFNQFVNFSILTGWESQRQFGAVTCILSLTVATRQLFKKIKSKPFSKTFKKSDVKEHILYDSIYIKTKLGKISLLLFQFGIVAFPSG